MCMLHLRIAAVALLEVVFDAADGIDRAEAGNARMLALPVVAIERVAQHRGGEIGALLVLRGARIAFGVLPQPLGNADDGVVFWMDDIEDDGRLAAGLEHLQFFLGVLLAAIVAPGLLLLLNFSRLGAEEVEILPAQFGDRVVAAVVFPIIVAAMGRLRRAGGGGRREGDESTGHQAAPGSGGSGKFGEEASSANVLVLLAFGLNWSAKPRR